MESGRSSGCVYRLVVELPGQAVVYDAAPFRTRKRAVAHVAAAVRRYALQGDITTVTLEQAEVRQRAPSSGSASGNGNGHWTKLERWDGIVVRRILEQRAAPIGGNGHGPRPVVPAAPPSALVTPREPPAVQTEAPATGPVVGSEAAVEQAVQPRMREVAADQSEPPHSCPPPSRPQGPQTARKGHRWHTAVMLVLAGLVWVALAVLLAGGHLISLFTDVGPARPQTVIDLPFDAPAATSPSPAVTPPDGSGAGAADRPAGPAPTANDGPSLILFRHR